MGVGTGGATGARAPHFYGHAGTPQSVPIVRHNRPAEVIHHVTRDH